MKPHKARLTTQNLAAHRSPSFSWVASVLTPPTVEGGGFKELATARN